ncbi:LPS export ABC transporter permease LptF [Catenovulum adriaticum]|uniref:Lipopolysaccharide export system permease protein LptF n=1 Tax=Catenovulum adriaticum TaxID=2984846 RepID=A0ABY7AIK9_9ALTE|nr:LPS export ABC transporter permease LptF [Catenovulum sp. TS8]WAJ69440.1 LPS export ABC transporter permease LptF [Catenovulum sp. TS8]
MIIFRYLLVETFKAQFAVFAVLMTIFTSQTLMRVLDDAVDGKLPTELVANMLMLYMPSLAGLILPLSLFIGIFLAHGQMYADSEMTVLKACGVSEWYVSRVTLVLALIIAIIAGLFSLWWTPSAFEEREVLRQEIKANVGLSSIVAGQFEQSSNKKAVIFVHENEKNSGQLSKVFVAQLTANNESENDFYVLYAKSGYTESFNQGAERLILSEGTAYQGNSHQLDYQITDFVDYKMIIKEQTIEEKRLKLLAVPTPELLTIPGNAAIAEWQWRISLPISVIIVALIAVPLARVKPRQGKYAKLVPAFAIYLCYFLLLMAGRSALEDGKIPPPLGLWWIHAGALAYGLYLFTTERTLGRQFIAKFIRRKRA